MTVIHKPVPERERLLSYSELAARIGINTSTLYTLVRQGRIPHVRLGRRLVRFSPQAVEQWIAANAAEVRE